jgi:uncharacterized protein YsxB (DUF464 family)
MMRSRELIHGLPRLGILLCGATAACTFEPGESGVPGDDEGIAVAPLTTTHAANAIDPDAAVDLNGDGRADVCGRGVDGVDCARSTGSAFGTVTTWQSSFSDAANWDFGPKYYSTIRFPDINGDHRADVCGRGVDGIRCALGTGAAFGALTVLESHFSDSAGWGAPHYYSTIRFPDVNGDGRADLCARGADGIVCALSTGTGFGPLTVWQSHFSDAGNWDAAKYYLTIRFPDVNGDGRADVCGRGVDGIVCAISSGTSFGTLTVWETGFSDANNWGDSPKYYSTIQFPDVNGDGRADVCGRGTGGVYCAKSNGTSFASVTVWEGAFSDANNWDLSQYYSTIQFPDVNGDGRADLCGRGTAGIDCALSTGNSFGTVSVWQSAFNDSNGWNQHRYYSTIQFADVNGDGRADICGRGRGGVDCALSAGTTFTLVSTWASAFSDAASWGTTPAYYSTIRLP